jgi:hypothetical protein
MVRSYLKIPMPKQVKPQSSQLEEDEVPAKASAAAYESNVINLI